MARGTGRVELGCSFCGKRQPAVRLVAGPLVTICSECVARCADTAAERAGEAACSFCGTSGTTLVQPPSRLGTQALICSGCLAICKDVVAQIQP